MGIPTHLHSDILCKSTLLIVPLLYITAKEFRLGESWDELEVKFAVWLWYIFYVERSKA